MKFLSKFIPFFSGISAFSLFGIGPSPTTVGVDISDALVWIFRSFIALCIAIIAYFLKGMIDDNKEENKKRDKKIDDCDDKYTNLIKITAAHEVMYQIWLDDMINGGVPEDGTRATDKVHRMITQLIAEKTK